MKIRSVSSGLVVMALTLSAVFAQAPPPQTPAAVPPRAAGGPPPRDAATPAGSAIIRGHIVAVDGGAPLRRVQIRLTGAPFTSINAPTATTDAQGRYEFKNLPAGRFTLSAAKTGYLTLSYGQRRPLEAARPIDLANAQTLDGIDFSLPKGAVIVVRLTDEFGEPISGATVQAQQYRFANGSRQLVSAANGPLSGIPQTDDQGEIRLYGLPPGDYYVSSAGSLGSNPALLGASDSNRLYGTTYYPGTASIGDAQLITLAVGQQTTITLPLTPVRVSSISGTVRSTDGRPFMGASVRAAQGDAGRGGPTGLIQPDGTFVIRNLVPGDYAAIVAPALGSSLPQTLEYAELHVTLGSESLAGVAINTTKGATLRGRFVFDTGEVPTNVRPVSFGVRPQLDPQIGLGRTTVNDDWTFAITDVFGTGTLRVASPGTPTANGIGGWFMKTVMLGNEDVTDAALDLRGDREIGPFQIVLTQKRSTVSGTAADAGNAPVRDYVAVVFAEDRRQWKPQTRFIAAGRPDQQGRFTVRDLPSGRYLAAAVDYLEAGEEGDPALLARLAENAAHLMLSEGGSETVTLAVTVR